MSQTSKDAVLIVGGESSGTRLVTQMFLAAGFVGDAGHEQRWDTLLPDTQPLVVWRRSLPHAGAWPDLREMVRTLRSRGYAVTACVTTRDWYATSRSQIETGHVSSMDTALVHLRRAYAEALAAFTELLVPYVIASYESLVARPMLAPAALVQLCGFAPADCLAPIVDANVKHYDSMVEMLTPAQRERLTALNTDHHERMSRLHAAHEQQNLTARFQQKNDESRAALLQAVLGCSARYAMRRSPSSVLELGASFGGERAFLLGALGAQDYMGVEIVEAAAKASPYVVHCAVEDMPDEWAGRFGYVWSRHVMEHMVDVDVALDTLKRVLAPNGIIAAVTPHFFPDPEPAHVTQLRMEEWIAAYQRHGLRVVYSTLGDYVCPECHIVAIHDDWPTQ